MSAVSIDDATPFLCHLASSMRCGAQADLVLRGIKIVFGVFLILATQSSLADNVGSCEVRVTGKCTFEIDGQQSATRRLVDTKGSGAMTTAWLKQEMESSAVKSNPLVQPIYTLLISNPGTRLHITCTSDKGTITLQSLAQDPKDAPPGPKKYRLFQLLPTDQSLQQQMHNGDMTVMLESKLLEATQFLQPSEPGELVITQNDQKVVAGTFHFKAKEHTVEGKFQFTNPVK